MRPQRIVVAVLTRQPRSVVLRFNEPVESAFGSVRAYDSDARRAGQPLRRHVPARVRERVGRDQLHVARRVAHDLVADADAVGAIHTSAGSGGGGCSGGGGSLLGGTNAYAQTNLVTTSITRMPWLSVVASNSCWLTEPSFTSGV